MFCLVAALQLVAVAWAQAPSFHTGVIVGNVSSDLITSCSGMGASRKHPGILYVHNDAGLSTKVFALNASNAALVATLTIYPAINNDWEDLAVGPCGDDASGSSCIYIADTGDDNKAARNVIYKVAEPFVLQTQTLAPLKTLTFTWDDPEADTLMVDPNGGLFIISKVLGGRGMIGYVPPEAWSNQNTVDISSTDFLYDYTSHHDPLSGDISPTGTEVLIKTYRNVFYWSVPTGDYRSALKSKGTKVPYTYHSAGQAVSWSADGSKYYTLSEGSNKPLYMYQRAN